MKEKCKKQQKKNKQRQKGATGTEAIENAMSCISIIPSYHSMQFKEKLVNQP